jgi:hypothetical protein
MTGLSPEIRLQALLDAIAASLQGPQLFPDVRLHLDPYDISDVLKESFRPPAGRIFVLKMEPALRPGGESDVELTLAVAAIAGRSGRPDPATASADRQAMALIMAAAAKIQSDPYFGQAQITAARLEGFRVATSEKSNDKGLAITLLTFSTTILAAIPEWSAIGGVMAASRPAGLGLGINGATLGSEIDP